ncbi:MAG: glutathione S-transferase C-terminal domain-containing protein [Pseudomonadota bacterium]
MGMLVDGRWRDEDRQIEDGAFVRAASRYSEDLVEDIAGALALEPGRYHLVASLSCPWSHRTLIVRALNGLAAKVPLQIAGGQRVEGYPIDHGRNWRVPGTEQSILHVHQLYSLSDPSYTGRASVPILWDAQQLRIVRNDSAAIMRAFDAARCHGADDFTLVPAELRDAIDTVSACIYRNLSNAVYRAGLAERQDAYDEAVDSVFRTLDRLEDRLSSRRYLFDVITEADWRLFTTLARFDAVYATHFRCTRRRLTDYPNLWGYARDLYGWRGIAETVDIGAILDGYYRNDGSNPYGIVAAPPDVDWRAAHGRAELGDARLMLRTGRVVTVEPSTRRIVDG